MSEQVQAAVIGGGIVGASVLYHLAKLGWTETVLLEKNELTAGSTWHAAGNTPSWSGSLLIARFQAYSIELYGRLEAETGQATGLHKPGSLSLACHPDRLDEYRRQVGRGKTIGLDFEVLTPEDCKRLVPPMNTQGLVGAIWDPRHGHVDPNSATHAMAKGARAMGAKILRHAKVTRLAPRPRGGWRIETPDKTLEAEVVINCAGQWAPEIARLAGSDLPIVPMLHQFVVTEAIPEIGGLASEMPVIRDRDNSFYMRQEGRGLVVGPYEKEPVCWNPYGIPPEFGQELLPEDLERIEEGLLAAAHRMPCFETAGLARIVNGPISYTPDERPLIGPQPGLKDMWVCAGTAVGIVQGGGMGRFLAEWLVEGYPAWDPLPVHPGRFGDYATTDYTIAKAVESYAIHHMVPYPGQEHQAGRPARTTALYDRQTADGAVFGSVNGWERPLWFAPEGVEPIDTYGFRRPESFQHVGAEHIAAREAVALFDMSIFGKYEVSGPEAKTWVERVFTGRAPPPGRAAVTLMCDRNGGILGDFAISALGEGRYYIVGAGGGEGLHWDWFNRRPGNGATLSNRTAALGVLHLAGPNARALLADLVRDDVSNAAMPFLAAKMLDFGVCKAVTIRVSFSGDLGYEIHVPVEFQRALYAKVRRAGAAHGLRLSGGRALHTLRLEKGWYLWGSDLTTEVDPYQAGLGFMVSLKKNVEFSGRAALQAKRATAPSHRLALLCVAAKDADCLGGEPILAGDRLVGQVTSGGYGHWVKQSLAIGWIENDRVEPGAALSIELYGDVLEAKVLAPPPFDADDARLRG